RRKCGCGRTRSRGVEMAARSRCRLRTCRRRVGRGGLGPMSSTTWAEAVLVVTVLAPVAAVVLAVALALPDEERRVPVAGCVVAAVGAGVLLVAGQHPSVARLAPDDLALAAIVGVALLAVSRPADERTPL